MSGKLNVFKRGYFFCFPKYDDGKRFVVFELLCRRFYLQLRLDVSGDEVLRWFRRFLLRELRSKRSYLMPAEEMVGI